jgi:tetratricopeptide (TPR) repeat protein
LRISAITSRSCTPAKKNRTENLKRGPRRSPEKPAAPPSSSAASHRIWRRHALFLLVLCAFALLTYSNSFRAGFVFDNGTLILQDPRIKAATPHNIDLILTQDYWYKRAVGGVYRPLTTFSYLFNYTILGSGAHPASYHWVNFTLHAINISLVYLLAFLLLQEIGPAFAVAAVWALHPVVTESVTNMVGRADLLSSFAVLAGLLCSVRSPTASGWRKLAWLLALSLVSAIGLFSKESAVVVLGVMVMYDLTWRTAPWRAHAPGYLAVLLPAAFFFYARHQVLEKLPAVHSTFVDNPLVGAGFWTARLTAVKVIGKYLWLLVWPRRLSCDYSYDQIPLVSGRWNTGEDWKAVVALAVCVAAALTAIRCYRRNKPVFFFIALFFVTLAPTSNVFMVIGTIMAERFLYLPSIGFAGCLVVAIYAACRRLPAGWPGSRIAAAVLTLICMGLAGRTYIRNFDWLDESSLWTAAVRACPASAKTHMNLASAWGDPRLHKLDGAVSEIDRALAILSRLPDERNTPVAYTTAGVCYRLKGDALVPAPQSRDWYQKSRDVLLRGEKVYLAYVRENRRQDLLLGRTPSEVAYFQLYLELGRTYLRLSDPHKALEAFEQGRRLQLAPELFQGIAAAYRNMGDLRQAAITLIEAIAVDPGTTRFAGELVGLYSQIDPQSCAVRHAGGSVSLNLNCPLVHGHVCEAFHNVVQLFLQMSDRAAAARARSSAISELGCPPEPFR